MKCLQCEREGHYRAGSAYTQPLCEPCEQENNLLEKKELQTHLTEIGWSVQPTSGIGNWSATNKKGMLVIGNSDGKWLLIKGYCTFRGRGLKGLQDRIEEP